MTNQVLRERARPAASGLDVFIGRQPIYDRDLNVVAYELLFRRGDVGTADVIDGDEATFTVMINALIEMGLSRLVGDKRAFINLTRSSVLCEYASLFPKDKVVLEVLEDCVVDDDLVDLVARFRDDGYEVALDDFVYRDEVRPLLDAASIVKVDIQDASATDLSSCLRQLGDVTLLAEKVETEQEFDACRRLGFDLFQGYFLGKPQVVKVKHVPTSQTSTLRVLSALHGEDESMDQVVEAISEDPGLTFRILRSAVSDGDTVTSLREAVDRVGRTRLSQWVTLLAVSGQDDANPDLSMRAFARARFCASLARELFPGQEARFFLCGQLSLLPETVGASLEELLGETALDDATLDALWRAEGPAGLAVQCAEALEAIGQGCFPGVPSERLVELWTEAAAEAAVRRIEIGF